MPAYMRLGDIKGDVAAHDFRATSDARSGHGEFALITDFNTTDSAASGVPVRLDDYTGSGFDRGHMTPGAVDGLEVDSFSWGASAPGEAAASAGWREYRISVDTIEAVVGDDVIVDGRIITGENPASAAMADVEWKYVTVRPPAALEDLPAALLGPFDDLSNLATTDVDAGGPYSTGYVKVSDNAV